jgi:hypothetical protein
LVRAATRIDVLGAVAPREFGFETLDEAEGDGLLSWRLRNSCDWPARAAQAPLRPNGGGD